MANLLRVATRDEVPEGRGLVVLTGGRYIAVFNVAGQLFAIDNRCAHEGASLGDGFLEDTCITCPWHGWRYDVRSGVCLSDPRYRVRTFPVQVVGEDILVEF
jgi:NAD(P)H-dependent nitrite reductase small subunit